MAMEVIADDKHYYVNEKNRLHGEFKTFYHGGELHVRCHYYDGKLHGEYKAYDRVGRLVRHCHCVNGSMEGESKEYHNNGKLRRHCFYIDGNIQGECKTYNRDGTLDAHNFYKGRYDIKYDLERDFDLDNITEYDRTIIKLTHGIECLTPQEGIKWNQ